jgi:hypothetical protein
MRTLIVGLLAGAMAILTGCTKEPKGDAKAESFEVKAPAAATALKQGESKTVKLTVERGKEFKQAVKLTADAPAAPGEAKVTLKATPEKGDARTVEVKVSVEENKKPGS